MTTATRTSRNDGYGRSTRFYEVEGEKFPSVTAILGAVAKPALVPWAAKQEREMVYAAVRKLIADDAVTRKNFMVSLEAAVGQEKAHSKMLAKAGTIGSEAHSLIEWNVRRELKEAVGTEPQISDKALWAFMAYEDWRKSANLGVVLTEQTVFSKRYKYAGTTDLVADIDHEGGRVGVVADFKTDKAIYGEAHLQVAAYGHALVEMEYLPVMPHGCVIRLPKQETDPNVEVLIIPPDRMKTLHKVFLNVLEVWKWQDEGK